MANTKDTGAAAKTYSFATAKTVLTDTEKERCLALFLNCDHKSIDWTKATADFKCASVDSMKVMTRATLKKITDAEANGGTLPTSAKGGRKRKAAAAAPAEGDDAETPVKKGKGRKKKADTPVENEEEGGKGKGGVEKEGSDEEDMEF